MRSILVIDDPIEFKLISLADFKTELGITSSDDDAQLTARIVRASKAIAERCNRRFSAGDAVETFVLDRCEHVAYLPLSIYPVAEIESVTVGSVEIDADLYEVNLADGLLSLIDSEWTGRVVVTYSGGYELPSGAPGALQQAVIAYCADLSQQATVTASGGEVRSITHIDTKVDFSTSSSSTSSSNSVGTPTSVEDLIAPFRRHPIA